MDASHLLLAQSLSLTGLIGGAAAYAGLIRRRAERVLQERATLASQGAVERVTRTLALGHLEHTYLRGHYPASLRGPWARRRR
jgi:hypothetical protein